MKSYKVRIISQNVYEKEVIALSEDEAYNIAVMELSDDDKIAEENFDVEDIEEIKK